MNLLEELYFGNINPQSKCFDRKSEYAKFMGIVCDSEEKLNACLKEEEKHIFSRFMNAQNEILDISERERFIEGFQMGAKLMLDTFLVPRSGPFMDLS